MKKNKVLIQSIAAQKAEKEKKRKATAVYSFLYKPLVVWGDFIVAASVTVPP